MMAGTRPCRRVRRAGPLPNSVRGSATMRTSGTVVTPLVRKIWRRREMLARGPRAGPGQAAAWQTKTRTQARWAESLAGCGHTRACPPRAGWVLPELADVGHRQHGLTSLVGDGQVHPRGQAPIVITSRVIEDLAHLPAARELLDDQQPRAARGRAG